MNAPLFQVAREFNFSDKDMVLSFNVLIPRELGKEQVYALEQDLAMGLYEWLRRNNLVGAVRLEDLHSIYSNLDFRKVDD